MVRRGCTAQCNVLLAGSIAKQRLAAYCRIKESGCVARKRFVTECVVGAVRRISQRLKSDCRTLPVICDCTERLKTYCGVGAAGSFSVERVRTNGGIRPNFGISAPPGVPPVVFSDRAAFPMAVF